MSEHMITTDELNAHLWGAADILRGTADASDFKNHIFGLLFLKRLSDVFDERRQEIIDEYVKSGMSVKDATKIAETDADEYTRGSFFIPKSARWSELMKHGENRAEQIDKALRAIEDQNSEYLEGVLAGVTFNDERRFGDAKEMDGFMQRLLTHFDKVKLGNRNLSEPDVLGNAYEYLVERFAETAGKKGGEFRTPKEVVRLLVELLAPQEGMRICDPTCGSCGMLIGCARYVEDHEGNPQNLSLFGQEKNYGTWAIGKLNMLLHALPDSKIEKGDTIRGPRLLDGGRLMLFDRVIANPPFSLKDWGYEEAASDPYGRFTRGIPPKTKGDLAFLMHMVETTNDKGMVGVVMPHGVLFRGASEGKIRVALLNDDFIEAVIGLPPALFFGTGIPASILILNRNKPKARRKKVLFIDASPDDFYLKKSARNQLRPEDIMRIVAVFRAYADAEAVPKQARKIAKEWLHSAELHRDRQLERVGDDEAVKHAIEEEFADKQADIGLAITGFDEWLENDTALARFASIVELAEIADENDYNLNISRYVDSAEPPPELDVAEELAKLREVEKKRDAAEKQMDKLLAEIGYK